MKSQIDYVLIDGRRVSDIIDVRTYRGANIDSDHYLEMAQVRQKLSVVNNIRFRPTHRLEELECEEMEQLYRSQETRKFYKELFASRKGFVLRAEMCRDKDGGIMAVEREAIERWKQHHDEYLNNVVTEDQDGGRSGFIGTVDEGDIPAPKLRYDTDAIKQFNNNKAAGKDGILAELIELGQEKLATCLLRLIARFWDTEQQGDKLEYDNYSQRGLQSISQIIFRRLSLLASRIMRYLQVGLVDGRSATDQIFTLRQILCCEYQVRAAYDSINREELWTRTVFRGN